MITLTKGNILKADAEALVNTVNCVGFMGKGIALQFKKAYPDNFNFYHNACKRNEVIIGKMLVYKIQDLFLPKYIINFPTKNHWRGKSRLEDIKSGIAALIEEIKKLKINSVAIPPLGCGLGGLDWKIVRPLIEKALTEIPQVKVLLYEPEGSPAAQAMPIGTKKPSLTIARALLIKLMHQYSEFNYRLTLLEIHKLGYFLQEAGQPLRLKFVAGLYGPYAHNLNKVLERLEGHYTSGYGDTQKPDVEISLLPGAVKEADQYLENMHEPIIRLGRVANLIEGFETPYGMELLSSVHWVTKKVDDPATNLDKAIEKVHGWNSRKRMFKPDHIRIAWEQLESEGWL
ncbi:MAG: macro domain-containing protein [Pseudomonadota bacterium]